MANFLRDTRFGFRLLRKNPGFATVAILALALGIGANTAIFSIFYATLLAPFPYPQPDQLVVLWSTVGGNRNAVWAGYYLDWKRDSKVFQVLGAVSGEQFNVSAGVERAVQVEGSYLTPGFLDQLIVGNTLWRGSEHHRQANPLKWRALYGDWSAAAWAAGSLGQAIGRAAGVHAGSNQSRFSLAGCLGTHEARSHARASER